MDVRHGERTEGRGDRCAHEAMPMRAWRRACCALLLALTLPAGTALAEDVGGRVEIATVDLESLLDLTVEAVTRHIQRASEAPATVFVVSADDIRQHGFRTLEEVLAVVPGLFTYPGLYPQLGVRGVGVLGDSGFRLLVMLDGHPLHNDAFGSSYLGRSLPVPLVAVQRIEVIKGPVGSVYGPAAFLGVVNVVTTGSGAQGAEGWAGVEAAQGSLVGREAAFRWAATTEGLEALVSGGVFSTRGLDWTFPELLSATDRAPPPGGRVVGADGADAENGYVRLGWRGLSARGGCGHSFRELPSAPYGTLLQDRRNAIEDLTCFALVGARREFDRTLTVSGSASYDETHYRDGFASSLGMFRDEAVERWGTGELRAEWRPLQGTRIDTGATVQAHRLRARSYVDGVPSAIEDPVNGIGVGFRTVTYRSLNTWMLLEQDVGSALTLHAGMTFYSHQLFGGRVTPKLAAVWRPGRADTIKALWSEGFRTPSLTEAFYDDQVSYLANPALRPESVSSLELAWDHQLGGVASFQTSLFRNQYRDLIRYVLVPAPGLDGPPDPLAPSDFRLQAVNADSFEVRGAEASMTVRWGEWLQGYGGASVQQVDQPDQPNFPSVTANFALSTHALWRPLGLGARAAIISRRAKAASSQATVAQPAVGTLVNLGATATLDLPGVPGLSVELSAVNLLDGYLVHPAAADFAPITEMPEPARTFRLSVRYRPGS